MSKDSFNYCSKQAEDTTKDMKVRYAPELEAAGEYYDKQSNFYMYGYCNEEVKDDSPVRFITEFEKILPLREIALVEFERRIKKLMNPAMKDQVSVFMLIECFKDHKAFKNIDKKGTIEHDLLFADMFLFDKADVKEDDDFFDRDDMGSFGDSFEEEFDEPKVKAEKPEKEEEFGKKKVSVPLLMLLGLLYCPSTRKQRAEKFYELVEIELTEMLDANDVEFREYVPKIYEIVNKLMFELYEEYKEPDKDEFGDPLMPDIHIENYIPSDERTFNELNTKVDQSFRDTLFHAQTRLTRQKIVDRLSGDLFGLL